MDEELALLLVMFQAGGMFTPLIFVLFHTLRQFLFIPVVVLCIAGGILFGTVFGTLYSLIGLMISSIVFYALVSRFPRTQEKLSAIRKKWFGEYRNLTVSQIAILRLVPFVHYQLLNFCLMERHRSFKDYSKAAFVTNLPLAFFYTVFGQFISRFTPTMIVVILFALTILVYVLREKMTVIKWRDFFKEAKLEKQS
jgi:uncharacterized membrane protein YdjX (TVP38/TMEM64 family)